MDSGSSKTSVKTSREERTVQGEVIDPTPPGKIDLRNLEAVRREMARVYREMRSLELPPEQGTRLVYVLDRIGKMIEVEQIERRIAEIERKLLK